MNNFEQIAFAALTSNLKAPVAMHPTDFQDQVKELNSLGFKEQIEIPENDENLTIKVVYKITQKSKEIKENVVKNEYDIIVGIVAKKDGEVLKQDGVQQTVMIVVPKENNEKIIQNELLKYIYSLIEQVASKF